MNLLFEQKPDIATDSIALSGAEIDILRLDKIHPDVSGNKWFKLVDNFQQAKESRTKVLTFGGAYSNHIAAVAAAGKLCGISTIGIIRGEEDYRNNPTLSQSVKNGMTLEFISRDEYRQRGEPKFLEKLKQKFGNFHLIPEGGSNVDGVRGASRIPDYFSTDYDLVTCAVGTGGTLAGMLKANLSSRYLGFPVLKGVDYLAGEIRRLSGSVSASEWSLNHDYHFGGYARINDELIAFIKRLYADHGIKSDPVYTGKLFYAVNDLLQKGALQDQKILVIHSGGLQGIQGMESRLGYKIFE